MKYRTQGRDHLLQGGKEAVLWWLEHGPRLASCDSGVALMTHLRTVQRVGKLQPAGQNLAATIFINKVLEEHIHAPGFPYGL